MSISIKLDEAIRFIVSHNYKQTCTAHRYKDMNCIEQLEKIEVIFPAFLSLHALCMIPEERREKSINKWIKNISHRLESESKRTFSFNYWTRAYKDRIKSTLPDDLDDTAYSLAALIRSKKNISEKFFLKIIGLEKKPGGPYRTWFVGDKAPVKWRDIDPTVNAAFLYLSSLYGIKLQNTNLYLKRCLKNNNTNSAYYPSDLMFYYNLSKYINCSNDIVFRELILKELKKFRQKHLSLQEKLLYTLCQAWLDLEINQKHFKSICRLQNPDGSLLPLPVCYDYPHKGKSTFVSSKVATTSLFVELLCILRKKDQKKEDTKFKQIVLRQKKLIKKQLVEASIKSRVTKLFPIEKNYKALIIPISLALSIKNHLDKKESQILDDFCLASFFTWAGYTLIDNFLDKQSGVETITLSSSLVRVGLQFCQKIIRQFPEYEKPLMKAFATCDGYYDWEIKNARFKTRKDIKRILQKKWSYQYILKRMQPFLVSLSYLPSFLNAEQRMSKPIFRFFASQILIDQLNDDVHDWKEDHSKGIMTYVLYLTLSRSKNKKSLVEIFNKHTLVEIIRICKSEYQKAEESLRRIALKDSSRLKQILDISIKPILEAEKESESSINLLKAFRS